MSRCTKCKIEKDSSEFYGRSDEKGKGYWSHCKECVKAKRKIYVVENREKIKNYDLKKNFGIDLDEYNAMYARQRGCCDICGKHSTEQNRALAVDHDHKTGELRSLLCDHCNHGLGKFSDSEEMLQRAIDYLKKHRTESADKTDVSDQTVG